MTSICATCHDEFKQRSKTGRPRKHCYDCSPSVWDRTSDERKARIRRREKERRRRLREKDRERINALISGPLALMLHVLVLDKIVKPPDPPRKLRPKKLDGTDLSMACGCGRDYLQVPIDEQCCPHPRDSRGEVPPPW